MTRFITSLLISVLLITTWLLTYLMAGYPGQGQVYFQVAPWWHIGLQVVWVISCGVTGLYGIYWYWDSRLRREELSKQPPYQPHH